MELIAKGKSDQEGIEFAIESYDDEKELSSIDGQLFQEQKNFSKWVLYLAIMILVLSLIIFGVIRTTEERSSNENSIVASKVLGILQNKEAISEDMKSEIEKLVNGTDQISKVQIYNVRKYESLADSYDAIFEYIKKAKPDYQYEKKVWAPTWLLADFYTDGNGDSDWFVNMDIRYFSSFATLVLIVGVGVYTVLFTIWATINAHHHKRLNIGWIILFALFNVLGYLVYRYRFVFRNIDFLKINLSDETSITIDVSLIKTSHELHLVLKEKLAFPETYGEDWDAFWDIITGPVELPQKLEFIGWSELERKLPEESKIIKEYLLEHNQEFPDWHCNIIFN